MNLILSWVKSGLLFGIFSSVILMLCPNQTYQKYISLVIGFVFILVMMHPILYLLHMDNMTYTSFVQNYIRIQFDENTLSDTEQSLYEETVRIQLQAGLKDGGYPVKNIDLDADTNGIIRAVTLYFSSEIMETEVLEQYLKNLFGEDVTINYEME